MTVVDLTIAKLVAAFDATEIWRDVPDWPYQVSSWGRVRRNGRSAPLRASQGVRYLHVRLSKGNVAKTFDIHRLVAKAFLGPPPFRGAEAAHNDGNVRNCRASNLRWATAADNQADRVRHGTMLVGSALAGAKLTERNIPAIRRRLAAREPQHKIAASYDVSVSTISMIARGKTWRHVKGRAA